MARIKLASPNPLDGITTFTKTRFYEANDSAGTGSSAIQTVDVDLTFLGPIDPGFTTYTYPTGSTTKYYASDWYNPTTGAESSKSVYVLGGEDRWDEQFKNEMDDTAGAVWGAEDRARFKRWALEALYPELFRRVVDTSLTLDNTGDTFTYIYTLPFGIFNVAEVGVGDVTSNDTSPFRVVDDSEWMTEGNKLHFTGRLPSTEDGSTIRLLAGKKFFEVGEVPEMYDEIVMWHMKMSAYLNLSEDYPRFKTFAQLQKGSGVSFENLRVQAREYERKFEAGKLKASEMLFPASI